MTKSVEAFRTISEVADELEIPKHVLRFWEVKFPQIKPMKRGGGRRYYRPEDVVLLRGIQNLLHAEGYTIKGVQKILREQGIEEVKLFSVASPKAPGKGKAIATPTEKMGRIRRLARGSSAPKVGGELNQRQVADLVDGAIRELEACRVRLWQANAGPISVNMALTNETPARKGARGR